MRRFIRTAVAFIAGVAIAAGALAQAPEKKKITIAVGGKSLFYYLPLTVAERKGYFKDEGLEVEIPDFAGGARALQALVGGSADMVSGAYEHTINMAAKKQPIKAGGAAGEVQLDRAGAAEGQGREVQGRQGTSRGLKDRRHRARVPPTNMFVNNHPRQGRLSPPTSRSSAVGTSAGAFAAMRQGRDRRDLQPGPGDLAARVHGQVRRGRRQPHEKGMRTSTAATTTPP
jgi:NitT/TauT family transport system substrate-binding protein